MSNRLEKLYPSHSELTPDVTGASLLPGPLDANDPLAESPRPPLLSPLARHWPLLFVLGLLFGALAWEVGRRYSRPVWKSEGSIIYTSLALPEEQKKFYTSPGTETLAAIIMSQANLVALCAARAGDDKATDENDQNDQGDEADKSNSGDQNDKDVNSDQGEAKTSVEMTPEIDAGFAQPYACVLMVAATFLPAPARSRHLPSQAGATSGPSFSGSAAASGSHLRRFLFSPSSSRA